MSLPPLGADPSGRTLARQVLNADTSGRLAALTRRASRELAGLRCGITEPNDALASAIRTLLRRQDPYQKVHHRSAPDPAITAECDVWSLLEKHLDRKIDTARNRAKQRRNQGVRLADLRDEESQEAWLSAFVDGNGDLAHEDPEVVESYLRDLMATLDEILAGRVNAEWVNDPQAREVITLKLLNHSQRSIAQSLGMTHREVVNVLNKTVDALRSALKET